MRDSSEGPEGGGQPLLKELLAEARQSAGAQVSRLEARLRRAKAMGAARDAPAEFKQAQDELARLQRFVPAASYEELNRAEELAQRVDERIDRAVTKVRRVRAARRWRESEEEKTRSRLIVAVAAVTVFYGAWILVAASIAGAIWSYGYFVVFALVAAYFLILWWQAPLVVRFQLSCRDLSADERRRVEPIIEELAARVGLPPPQTAAIGAIELNAFAVGRRENSAIILTSGALTKFNEEELRGVMAHELGHIAGQDSVWLSFFLALGGAAAWIATIADWILITADRITAELLAPEERDDSGAGMITAILVATLRLTIWILLLIIRALFVLSDRVAQLAVQAQSRGQEFVADAFAAELGHGGDLARALDKMERYMGLPAEEGPIERLLTKMFASHPPTAERLAKLQATEQAA